MLTVALDIGIRGLASGEQPDSVDLLSQNIKHSTAGQPAYGLRLF